MNLYRVEFHLHFALLDAVLGQVNYRWDTFPSLLEVAHG
jgi:hypothetical protein